jgi:thiol-disulfide isomerase/thioredoxin
LGHARLLRHALGLVATCASLSVHAATLEGWSGGPTPPLTGRTLAGEPYDLAQRAGRVVIVNFWATWCAPCVAEMPSLQRLRDKLGVEVIAVNFQENAARIQPFLERNGIGLPVMRDHDGSLRDAWRVNLFPSTFVIAKDGRIAFVAKGEVDWDAPAIEARIAGLR